MSLLEISLDAAVGLRLLQWKQDPSAKPDPWEHIHCLECKGAGGGKGGVCFTCGGEDDKSHWMPRHEANAQYIASRGDALMFKTPGVTAEVFNVLAESLALMAYFPGGVRFMGLHWEAASEKSEPIWAKRVREVVDEYAKRIRKVEWTKRVRTVEK